MVLQALSALPTRVAAKILPVDGCWVWTGARVSAGYGSLGVGKKTVSAHRFMYTALVGPIPEGLHLDHLCRNRACCNPEHLEPVTSRENTLRGETLAAACAAKTHCPKGHEYTPDNVLRAGRKRICRECRYLRSRAKYQNQTPEERERHRIEARDRYRRKMTDPAKHEAAKQAMRDYYQRKKAAQK